MNDKSEPTKQHAKPSLGGSALTQLLCVTCNDSGVFNDYGDGMIVEFFCDCDVGNKMFQKFLHDNPEYR